MATVTRRWRRTLRFGWVLVLLAVSGLWTPDAVVAQGIRGDFTIIGTSTQYRRVVRESIPDSLVAGDGLRRTLPDGTIVTCIPGVECYYYRPADIATTTPVTQNLRFTAWTGITGLSARVDLRGRYGSEGYWPRNTQEFEALQTHLELQLRWFRLRVGRQDHRGGLGAYYFDGFAFLWKGIPNLRLEGFMGLSLARTLRQQRDGELLAAADRLAPNDGSTLWGAEARYWYRRAFSATLLYQRELRRDRSALYSERLAFDARYQRRGTGIEASLDFDFATAKFNEATLRWKQQAGRRVFLTAHLRRYLPYFDLWTIWGAFSPVGYTQGLAQVHVTPVPDLQLRVGGSYRSYDETHTGVNWITIHETGWSVLAGARWTPRHWVIDAGYDGMSNFGAIRSRFDLSLSRGFDNWATVGLFGSATQQFERFRYGDGRSAGGGLRASLDFRRFGFDGNAGWYHHRFLHRPGFDDYDQFRARLRLTVRFSTEPDAVIPWRSGAGNRMRAVLPAATPATSKTSATSPSESSSEETTRGSATGGAS